MCRSFVASYTDDDKGKGGNVNGGKEKDTQEDVVEDEGMTEHAFAKQFEDDVAARVREVLADQAPLNLGGVDPAEILDELDVFSTSSSDEAISDGRVDLDTLSSLQEDDLKELGLAVGARVKLMRLIRSVQAEG